MLNWVFLKKLVFTTTITLSTTTPIYLIYRQYSPTPVTEISRFKRGITNWSSGSYTDNTNLSAFSKYALKSEYLEEDIAPMIAREISYQWLKNENQEEYKKADTVEENTFKMQLKIEKSDNKPNPEQKLFDRHGGTRRTMKKRYLAEKGYDILKQEVLNFSSLNFELNTKHENGKDNDEDWQKDKNKHFIVKDHYLSKTDLEKPDNWSKISWYPIFDEKLSKSISLQEFNLKKFAFINYAYKRWFLENQPFNVHAALWKYDEDNTNINSFYNTSEIKNFLPSKPNYKFPLFTEDKKEIRYISKIKKFEEFVKKITSENDSSNANGNNNNVIYYLPTGYTDDISTSIYVEGANMYERLYTEFASASAYMYGKLFNNDDISCFLKNNGDNKKPQQQPQPQQQNNDSKNLINEIKKEELKSKKLEDLFLEDDESKKQEQQAEQNNKTGIKFESKILDSNGKSIVYDAREMEGGNWLFIRNEAGIHAIKIDGLEYIKNGNGSNQSNGGNNSCTLERAYKFFNFRLLQSFKKKKLSLDKTLDGNGDEQLNSFKSFIADNFDYLLIKYFEAKDNKNNWFSRLNIDNWEKLKDVVSKNLEILKYKKKVKKIDSMREKILNQYSTRKYLLDDAKKFKNSDPSEGLSAPFPYGIDLDLSNNKLFPSLEKIYDLENENPSAGKEKKQGSEESMEIEKMYEEYYSKVDTYIDKLKLKINTEYSFFNSDRLFTNNYLIDWLIEKFMEKSNSLNQYILTNALKNKYLESNVKIGKNFQNETNKELFLKQDKKTTKKVKKESEEEEEKGNEDKKWFDILVEKEKGKGKGKKGKKQQWGVKTFKDFAEFVNRFYYKKSYIPNNNFWTLLKHGKWKTNNGDENQKNENNSSLKDIETKIEKIFKKKYFLNFHHERENYLNFLTTIVYLTKNKFQNFRDLLKKTINYENKAFLVWNKLSNEIKNFDDKNIFHNPWFSKENNNSNTYEKDRHLEKLEILLSSQDDQTKAEKEYIFKDLIVIGGDLSSWNNWTNLAKTPDKILRFSSRDEMIGYINKITNSQELNQFINNLKQDISGSDLSTLNADIIYIEKDNNDASSLRSLTLEERKNALLAWVNNYKIPSKDTAIKKENYKSIYLLDPDKGYSSTSQTHTKKTTGDDWNENIKDDDFNNYKEFEDETKKNNFLIQLKHSDVSDITKFQEFVNSNLNSEVFWEWLLNTAIRPEVQSKAIEDLEKNIAKMLVYDEEWEKNLKDKYIKDIE